MLWLKLSSGLRLNFSAEQTDHIICIFQPSAALSTQPFCLTKLFELSPGFLLIQNKKSEYDDHVTLSRCAVMFVAQCVNT